MPAALVTAIQADAMIAERKRRRVLSRMSLSEDFADSLRRQLLAIELAAWEATRRLAWMHAISSGQCYCGEWISDHGWEGHAPVTLPIDKSWAS